MELFDIPKRSVARWSVTDSILPTKRRRRDWRALSEAFGLKLPGLEYSSTLCSAIWWGSFVELLILFIALPRGASWAGMAVILWIGSIPIMLSMLRPFADQIPTHCGTFGDFAKTVVALNYGKLAREMGRSRDAELLEAIRYLIADLVGVEPFALVGKNPTLIDIATVNDGFRMGVRGGTISSSHTARSTSPGVAAEIR